MPPAKQPKTTTPVSEQEPTDSKPDQDMVVRLNDIVDEADKDATDTITKSSVPAESAKIDYGNNLELWRKEIIDDLRPKAIPAAARPTAQTKTSAIIKTEPDKNIKTENYKSTATKVESLLLVKPVSWPHKIKSFNHSLAVAATTSHIKSSVGQGIKRYQFVNFKNLHLYLLLGLFLATVFYSAIIWFRLDRKIPKVAEMLAIPVMVIDNHLITYDEFARDKLLIQRLNPRPDKRQEMSIAATEQLAKEVMIENYILQQTAKQNNLTVSDLNRSQLWENLQSEFGSKEALTKFINYNLGLSLNSYEQYVIEPYLWRLTILSHLNNDPTSQDQALRKISDLKNSIELGRINFAQAAATYSQDKPTAGSGGDLGWYAGGTLDPEFESALTKLKTGQISQPVRTSYGYHLIKLLDAERGADGKIKNYHAAHILIKTIDFDNWLAEQKALLWIIDILHF